jgi:hypothetical protein
VPPPLEHQAVWLLRNAVGRRRQRCRRAVPAAAAAAVGGSCLHDADRVCTPWRQLLLAVAERGVRAIQQACGDQVGHAAREGQHRAHLWVRSGVRRLGVMLLLLWAVGRAVQRIHARHASQPRRPLV